MVVYSCGELREKCKDKDTASIIKCRSMHDARSKEKNMNRGEAEGKKVTRVTKESRTTWLVAGMGVGVKMLDEAGIRGPRGGKSGTKASRRKLKAE